ncbi:MAG: tol-pal system YbgF family protein [Balneolaceae bacterium]
MKKKEILKNIELYIRGELHESEIEQLWEEFIKDPEYFELFDTELQLRHLGKKRQEAVKQIELNKGKPHQKIKSPIILACAAILFIAFGLFLFSTFKSMSIADYAIPEISHQEILGAEVFRSDTEQGESVDANITLNRGLVASLENRVVDAIDYFKSVLVKKPDSLQIFKANYNLGILYYNQKDYSASLTAFKAADIHTVDIDFLREKYLWYLGNTLLKNGNLAESERVISEVVSMSGMYVNEAAELSDILRNELQKQN